MTRVDQLTVRCVLARGGTSKGLYFHEHDLPPAGSRRDALLLRLMGSPDVLQIDGLGGSHPVTSKVAIIRPSRRDDADVEYTFAQVDLTRPLVDYSGNCGNISAGVGPFAVDEGLVEVLEPVTRVRIHNTNTDKILVADVPVVGGRAAVEGNYAIPGVPGTGAEIVMNWAATVGAKTGRLLPTGHAADAIELESGRTVQATLCDAANPVVWVPADDVGLSGSETAAAIDDDEKLLDTAREIRGKAAQMLGLTDDWRHAEDDSAGLPLIGFVATPDDYVTPNGADIAADDMDLRVRLLFMNHLHPSIAGTGSMSLTAASRIPGSVVAAVTTRDPDRATLRIGHPSGVMVTRVEVKDPTAAEPSFTTLAMSRTARRLMEATAYYPRHALDGLDQPTR